MKKLPSKPTRDQLVAWKIQNGECGLLRADWSTPCPKRGGPVNPSPDHPRLVGFPGENGYCTCSGCQYFLGLEFNSYVCTHPNARAVALTINVKWGSYDLDAILPGDEESPGPPPVSRNQDLPRPGSARRPAPRAPESR